jgi:acetyltransferase
VSAVAAPAGHVPEHECQTPGGAYRVRIARPGDEPALRRMLEAAAPEDIRFRFFRHVREFPHALVEPLTRADERRHFAFVAAPAREPAGLVASAMLVADADGRGGEFGIFVAHGHRGRGLGTHLLDCLKREAQAHGIGCIHGLILADNADMISLARHYGFTLAPDDHDPQCLRAEAPVAGATG